MKHIITILAVIVALCAGSINAMSSNIPDKYAQFLSCFSDSTYYAIGNVSGHEVLFVSREVFMLTDSNKVTPMAIAAQLYTLDDKGKVIGLGEIRSQGTAYPIALSNGTLLTAGHHFVRRYSVDEQPVSLSILESADETFNKKGKATYTYEDRVKNEYTTPKDNQKLTALFDEFEKADPIVFWLIPTEKPHAFIRPLPTGIDINNLTDATVSASFSTKDFGWMGGNLTMTIYAEQQYDTVDLHQLQVGDSILYSGDTIIVKKKEEKSGEILINDGFDNNGVTLWPYEGGTYRAVQFDDHSVYVEVGRSSSAGFDKACDSKKVQLPLSEKFTITDCTTDPQKPQYTIRKNQKLYLESLKGSRKDFSYLDSKVLIEHGVITNISRHWIP